jgi:stress response protein SCP2
MSRFLVLRKYDEELKAKQVKTKQEARANFLSTQPLTAAGKRNARRNKSRARKKLNVPKLPEAKPIEVKLVQVQTEAKTEVKTVVMAQAKTTLLKSEPKTVKTELKKTEVKTIKNATAAVKIFGSGKTSSLLPVVKKTSNHHLREAPILRASLTAAQKRNLRRKNRRIAKHNPPAPEPLPVPVTVVESPVTPETPETPVAPVAVPVTVPAVIKPGPKMKESNVDHLQTVPYHVLVACILPFLKVSEVSRFSVTCKANNSACEAGFLWKNLFCRAYPRSQLNPQSMLDWRTAYFHEQKQVASRFTCFSTGKNFAETILGLPISFSTNPVKKKVDYVRPSLTLISTAAFDSGVFQTPDGEGFDMVLPLYFSPGHFERALPLIKQVLIKLSPERETLLFEKTMILDVFPKLFNTLIVLVADSGISTGQRVLQTFMWLHRLFLAMVDKFNLQNHVENRISDFVHVAECRHKSQCPSLGDFLPLLLVSNQYTWKHVAAPYFDESMTRNVLWICKAHPSLASTTGPDDPNRLTKTFEAIRVGARLLMLNVLFLRTLASGTAAYRARSYDLFATAAELEGKFHSEVSLESLQQSVASVLGVTGFPGLFQRLGLRLPGKADFLKFLRGKVQASLRMGYHKKGMDFSRIHASGTSRVLKTGESYSVKEMSQLNFSDEWNFSGATKFLDATCLLFDEKKNLVSTVDFMNTRSIFSNQDQPSAGAAVKHSGDMMTSNSGMHTMDINLDNLPANVDCLVFVLSAYAGYKLRDIQNPRVAFTDAVSNARLCSYSATARNTGDFTAVIMCRLSRKGDGWHVQALGEYAYGCAQTYAPILEAIARIP